MARCLGHENFVGKVDLSPDGKLAVSGGDDEILRFWSVPDGKQVRTVPVADPRERAYIGDVKFSPDSKLVAALVNKPQTHQLRWWDVKAGKELQRPISVERGFSLAFSPNGSKLAVAGDGVQVWDLNTVRKLHDFQFNRSIGRAFRVVFSPDGTRLAAGLHDYGQVGLPIRPLVRVWDVESGKEVFTTHEERSAVNAVAFSPDSTLLAEGGENSREEEPARVHLWDLTRKRLVHALPADKEVIFCLAFHPSGKLLATGGDDSVIRLWDVTSGKLLCKLEGHTDQVDALTFSTDGKTLVSAGRDKFVLIWRIDWK